MTTKADVDLGLTALCTLAKPEQSITARDIAEVCNCNISLIFQIQQSAFKKLRKNAHLKKYLEDMMTSQELIPQMQGIIEEIKQINGKIDFDDPAEESMQTLCDVAIDTMTEMQTAAGQ